MAWARAFAGVKKRWKADAGGLRGMKARGQRKRYMWAPVSCSVLISTAYIPSQRIQVISSLLKGYNHAISHLQSKGHTRDPSTP